MDLYLPSVPSVGADFGASVAKTQLTLSMYIAGLAVGTLIYGPVSDRFGRKSTLLCGLVVYTLGCLACTSAGTIDQLIGFRFLAALGGCSGAVIARAIVRDLFERDEAARLFSYMGGAMALAPGLAPIVGGFIHVTFGWRGQFYTLAGLGLVLSLAAAALLRETNKYFNPNATDPARLLRNIAHLLRHRPFVGYALTAGFSNGGLLCFIAGGSFVLIDAMGVKPQNFGYLFIFVASGFMSGSLIGGKLTKRFGILKMMTAGLWIGLTAGSIGLALALSGVMTPLAVVAPVVFVFFSCAFVFPNAQAGALGPFAEMAGTASSIASFIQSALSAAIGSLVGVFFNGTAVPLFGVIVGSSLAGLAAFYSLAHRTEPF